LTAKFVAPVEENAVITSADCEVFPLTTIAEVVVDGG
jgi:hypothetical protein